MADHQPHLGPENGDVVADRLRIGGAHPDVDERDPRAPFRHQVIGGHLVPPPLARRDLGLGIGEVAALVDRARAPTIP